jgi:ribosomal protein S18 acetylase RimI-like enzyme
MAEKLPRLFLDHFQDTSFVAEEDGKLVAFLVGFISQSDPHQAYIHFAGVHPDYRRKGIARELYERFYEVVQTRGCDRVRLITSPTNKASIAFHTAMGYKAEPGDGEVDGLPVVLDYDGHGSSRVCFVLGLTGRPRGRAKRRQ